MYKGSLTRQTTVHEKSGSVQLSPDLCRLGQHTVLKWWTTNTQWRPTICLNNKDSPLWKPGNLLSSSSLSLISYRLFYAYRRSKFYPTLLWLSCILSARQTLQLKPAQRWNLAGSTDTRQGIVQLNASATFLCVGSRTLSSTRPSAVVWLAGPWRYGREAEPSHGTCGSHRISLLKYETVLIFLNVNPLK